MLRQHMQTLHLQYRGRTIMQMTVAIMSMFHTNYYMKVLKKLEIEKLLNFT